MIASTQSESVITYRGNLLGTARLLQGASALAYCSVTDDQCSQATRVLEGCRRRFPSIQHELRRRFLPELPLHPAQVFTGSTRQIASWSFRYDWAVQRDQMSRAYQREWDKTLANASSFKDSGVASSVANHAAFKTFADATELHYTLSSTRSFAIAQPTQSNARYVFSGRLSKNESALMTINAAVNWYDSTLPAEFEGGRLRDAQAAIQFDRSFGNLGNRLTAAIGGGCYWQYLKQDALISIPAGNLGIKIPLAVTFSNRTDLIPTNQGGEIRANFGILFDLDSLLTMK